MSVLKQSKPLHQIQLLDYKLLETAIILNCLNTLATGKVLAWSYEQKGVPPLLIHYSQGLSAL